MPTSPVVSAFRALHASGCFVIPNPWDVGTAVYFRQAGCVALATTSAGFAFSRGWPDEVTAVPRDAMVEHIKAIVDATPLPVSADFQNGYADEPEGVAANVTLCVGTGVAGLSIEDATGDRDHPLYERELAIERIRAARAAIDATGTGVVLTARCEAFLVGHPDAERIVLDRLVAFAGAGADCVFAPRVSDPATIATIVKAVAPTPVNVVVTAPGLTVAGLAALGVRRISVGSALSRVAWGAVIRSLRGILDTGTFDTFADAAAFADLNTVFAPR